MQGPGSFVLPTSNYQTDVKSGKMTLEKSVSVGTEEVKYGNRAVSSVASFNEWVTRQERRVMMRMTLVSGIRN